MNKQINHLKLEIKLWLIFFIVALVISGATAMPLATELNMLCLFIPHSSSLGSLLLQVNEAVRAVQQQYPFLFYGFDWLAFGHFAIAVAFFGPLKNPVKNIWVIEFGMIACIMIFPFALIMGQVRGIPFFWRLIDCCFGVFGFIPLWICRLKIKELEELTKSEHFNLVF